MKYWALAAGAALAVSAAALPAQAAAPERSGAPAPLTGQGVYLSYGNGIRVLKNDGRPVWASRDASFAGQFSASPTAGRSPGSTARAACTSPAPPAGRPRTRSSPGARPTAVPA
nr:hypothetical protein GCM10020093_111290 [Planobispora longispora]